MKLFLKQIIINDIDYYCISFAFVCLIVGIIAIWALRKFNDTDKRK